MLVYRLVILLCFLLILEQSSHVAVARPVSAANDLLKTSFGDNSIQTSARSSELILPGPHISPLKYKRVFKIRLPLKPKLFKHIHPHLHKKSNQSFKRDTKHGHFYRHKHVPFIKNFNMLFSDIVHSRDRFLDNEDIHNSFRNFVKQEYETDLQSEGTTRVPTNKTTANKAEKAVVVPTNKTIEFLHNPEDTIETSFSGPITSEISSSIFTSKNASSSIPEPPTTNSSGSWRDGVRYSYRNSTPNNTDDKRDLPRNYGDDRYPSPVRTFGFSAETIPEHTNSSSRNNTDGSFPSKPGGRGDRTNTITRINSGSRNNKSETEIERSPKIRSINEKFELQNKIKDRRKQTGSPSNDEKLGSGLRGSIAKAKETYREEPLQSINIIGESNNGNTQDDSSNQGVIHRNRTTTEKTEESGSNGVETRDDILFKLLHNNKQSENPVQIISGYSNYNLIDSKNKLLI